MTAAMRVQTGIGRFDDGWRVVQRFTNPDGSVEEQVYDPPFEREGDAVTKAAEAAELFRDVAASEGAEVWNR